MYEPRVKLTDAERDRYEVNVEDIPKGLDGITAELIADLHDCVLSFGGSYSDEPAIKRLSLKEPVELYVGIPSNPTRTQMLITGEGGVTKEGMDFLPYTSGKDILFVDTRVRTEDIQRFIEAVDKVMAEKGYINPHTGERRKDLSFKFDNPQKLSIEKILGSSSSVIAVPPGYDAQDAEKMRQDFDYPDEVVVYEMNPPFGLAFKVLIHHRHVRIQQERERIVRSIYQERGIDSLEDFQGLSFDVVMEIREETKRRLEEKKEE